MNARLDDAHAASARTHEVFNQTPPLADYNLYASNLALREAVTREGAEWADTELLKRGSELGSAEMFERGIIANKNPPELKLFDATGNRRDAVEFHPSYHELMRYIKRHGASGGPWVEPRAGAHVARAAFFMMMGEIDNGTLCPTTMTYAVVPALQNEPKLAEWVSKAVSPDYDHRFIPGLEKRGVTFGMGMTEKQGGSDVRANTTAAAYVGESEWGSEYRITGHKWFFSAPMCDGFLILAQTGSGGNHTPTCFFLPRFGPDGKQNDIRLQRLKDKVGDRSNAGSEVEFCDARAWRVGEESRGIQTILEMGTYTRLDCVLGTSSQMRAALSQAMHHASHRQVFGRRLIEQPMMQNVLADLALESEAATVLGMRLARAFDRKTDEQEALLARVLTPVAKYWVCKRGPIFGGEAMEVWGGNGYVEDGPLARIFRQMPLNSIWEGSGNVMGLDTLRALSKNPRVAEALEAELAPARGLDKHFDTHVSELKQMLKLLATQPAELEFRARELMQRIALAVQGSLLLQNSPDAVAETFCASRFAADGKWGAAYGVLPAPTDWHITKILARSWPACGLNA